jgi:MFS family permease
MAPFYGSYADARERQFPHHGRSQVLLLGVIVGTLCFWLHGVHYLFVDDNAKQWLDSFGYHVVVQCLYATCFAIMFPVLDGIALEYLQRQNGSDSMDYGKERLYGAVSWGITNLLFGVLIDVWGFWIAYPCALVTAVYSVVTLRIYAQAHAACTPEPMLASTNGLPDSNTTEAIQKHDDKMKPTTPPSNLSLLLVVLGTIYGIAFCLSYFLLATGLSVVENLVFLFFEFLGGSNTICGITVALTVLFEIPIFQIAPTLLRKYGVGWLLLLANVAFVVRIIGYTLIPQGAMWWLFLLEPLHGLTYAGSQSAAVEYVHQTMPSPGLEASGQGIVNLIRGSGSVLGLLWGGVLQDHFGPRVMYRVFATTITLGMTVFATVRCRYPQQEESYQRVAEEEPVTV